MSQTQTPPSPAQPSRSPRTGHPALGLLTVVFRLLLLGVGGGLAWLVGMAIAQIAPGAIAEPPLAEQMIRQVESLEARRQNLWERFRPGQSPNAAVEPATALQPLELSPAEQRLAEGELERLQTELQDLRDRTLQLETELGISPGLGPVDERLRQLQQRLDPNAASLDGIATVGSDEGTRGGTPGTDSPLLITLPSDTLFEADGQMLRPAARGILDSIARDLQSFPNAVIQVAAHTDTGTDAATQRVDSFAQASAVTQYLSQRLDSTYTWLTVGFGQTQPLETAQPDVPSSRNRRVEIRISPR